MVQMEENDNRASFTDEEVRHIKSVLRLKPGTEIIAFTGEGKEYRAILAEDDKGTHALLQEELDRATEAKLKITLFQGIAKGEKMDLIIRKCTEIGVFEFVPFSSTRTVVKLSREKEEKKRQRWQKIAAEAAKQSGRVVMPQVRSVIELGQMQNPEGNTLRLVLWEDERNHSLSACFKAHGVPEKLEIIVGPEGGLTKKEVDELIGTGAVAVSLGKLILRTETAGLIASALSLYESGDLG